MTDLLDKISHKDILLSVILLKQGKRIFEIEKLEEGLKKCSIEYPRLKISQNEIGNIFFFYNPYLSGEMDSPNYLLSREGREIFQKEFDSYSPDLQNELKTIAEKVWA